MLQETKEYSQQQQSEIILYIYLLNNLDMISCQGCCRIPYKNNKMYRIKNSRLYYYKNCIDKWINICNNPITGVILEKNDVEINYEINDLIENYLKYRKLNINNIKIDISTNKINDKKIIVH